MPTVLRVKGYRFFFELTQIRKLIEEHKDLIKEKWDEYFGG